MAIVDPRTGEPLSSGGNADTGANAGANQESDANLILDVDRSNIQQLLEMSMQVPVLLTCWSPASEQSKQMLPVLEKLTREHNGAFLLGKLNIDDNADIAGQLGVQSAPDVKLVSQGGLVDQLQGAQPEQSIREWLGKYFQAPEGAQQTPEEQAAAALEAGDSATARRIYEELSQQWPDHTSYQIELARALVADGEAQQARQLLDALPPEERDAAPARGVRASIEFGEEALSADDIAALGERDDSEARYQRALRQVADGHYESGLEGLLALMRSDRAYGEDAARKTLLRVFDALGADHPLTVTYRRQLFALLY
ncbi:tetratricopeptide repeat protein [Halomonas sp. 18H]|uniref:co-chaperone YbbN n=1 Tax=Halomonas almeriensis TaxID=308163 RepID=UPI0022317D51|nr:MULTISPECIES: tetratricopeptide repeat protein [Halomonas]MCW4152535.1 tetratricopeptide repeat protein [Halomonas sp. 18H]MDN3553889.1 tetratricopeptide repeat protein [Halomonas almeriensis]